MKEETPDAPAPKNEGDRPSRSNRRRIPYRNKAGILLEFRDGYATDVKTLLRRFRIQRFSTAHAIIEGDIKKLIDVGLLKADGENIRVTDLLSEIQIALGFSLKFLATIDNASMNVKPLFGIPGPIVEKLDVFVLMPFKADMLPVYEDHIKPTCASMELTVRRGDDFFTTHSVVQDIWKAIVSARLIVADCTDRNPNVFYEIGLAHTIGKPTILLTQREKDIPFDLRHLRYVPYQLTPRGMKEFEAKFKETLRNVLPES